MNQNPATSLAELKQTLAQLSKAQNVTVKLADLELPLAVSVEDKVWVLKRLEPKTALLGLATIARFANSSLVDYLPLAEDLFAGKFSLAGLEFCYQPKDGSIELNYSVTIDDNWPIIPDVLSLQKLKVNLNAHYTDVSGHPSVSFGGNVEGEIDIDNRLYFAVVHFKGANNWALRLNPQDGNVLPDLSCVAGLLGGETLQNRVKTGLDTLKFDELFIDGVDISFDLAAKRIHCASMASHATIGGVRMDLNTVLPDFQFGGRLAPDSKISFKALVEQYFGTAEGFPDAQIDQLSFSAYPSTGNYTFNCLINSAWPLPLGSLKMTDLSFDLDKTPEGVSGEILASIEIADAKLSVMAKRMQPGSGWLFEGKTGDGQQIAVASLDSKPPKMLESLTFEDLSVSFNTKSKGFTFSGSTAIELRGVESRLNLDINLTQNDDGIVEKQFAANLLIKSVEMGDNADPLRFDIVFDSTNDDALLLATCNNQDGASISLQQLLDENAPDITLSFHDALWAHRSKPYKQNLFAANMGTGINLSNLPLVGQLLGKEDAIKLNYAVVYASKEPLGADKVLFSEADFAQLNECLPQGMKPFNTQDMSKTKISAKLEWADKVLPLKLDLDEAPQETNLPVKLRERRAVATDVSWYPVQRSFGPVMLDRIGMKLIDDDLQFVLDASLSVNGLSLSLDGLSVKTALNKFSPEFDLQGLGVDFRKGPVEIGGALLNDGIGYSGTATLKLKKIALSAMGMYSQNDQHPSMFFYASLAHPLGGVPAFFITGLSAGFGYNRKLLVPGIEQIRDFPLIKDAGKNDEEINLTDKLEQLQTDIPPSVGDMFVALGLQFTSFKLIDSFALATVGWGDQYSLDLLGLSTLQIPPKLVSPAGKSALVKAEMALKASYQPDEGALQFKAQLTPNSYVLSKDCHLTGGFASYCWFDGEHAGDFVTTLGGYSPAFTVPDHYPTVPRLGMNWDLGKLTLKGEAYFALCSHAIMAGGMLDATYKDTDLKAQFSAGMDLLMAWQPYYYDANLYARLKASYTFDAGWFGTYHLRLEVGSKLHIWGPDFGGKATLDFGIVSVDMNFGESKCSKPQPLDWRQFKQSFLPEDNAVCTIAVSDGLIGQKGKLDVISPAGLALTVDSAIPLSQAGPLDLDDANTTFGISPMNKSTINSQQIITITKDGPSIQTQHFDFRAVKKNLPAALWGSKQQPALNDDRLIKNVVTGFDITPIEPAPEASIVVNDNVLKPAIKTANQGFCWQQDNLPKPIKVSADNRQKIIEAQQQIGAVNLGRNSFDHYFL